MSDYWRPESGDTRPPDSADSQTGGAESLTDYENFFRGNPGDDQPTMVQEPVAAVATATPPPVATPTAPRKRRRGLKILLWVLVGSLIYGLTLGVVFATSVTKVEAMPASQIPATTGTNYLLVGTDSRDNLTKKQRKQLNTGYIEGQRTDTIMLVHVPFFGEPTLVSIPRDSWVPIEGYGSDKINAAYALGGPTLLVDTVETTTGLHIDHYVEIGMDGVAEVVDALGGITLCPKANYDDKRSGLKIKKGCQEVDGKTALAYVRMRYSDPKGDIGRAERQREYIAAVAKKAMSPTTWLNPFKAYSVANATGEALTVDEGTGFIADTRLAVALGMISMERGESTSVPIETDAYWVGGQQAVKWDTPKALALFDSLS